MSNTTRFSAGRVLSLLGHSSLSLASLSLASLPMAACDPAPAAQEVASTTQAVICKYCVGNGPYLQSPKVDGTLVRTLLKDASSENWGLMNGMGTMVDAVPLSTIKFNSNDVFQLRGNKGFLSVTYLEPPFSVRTRGGLNTTGLKLKVSLVNGGGVRRTYNLRVFGVTAPPPNATFPTSGSPNYAFFDLKWAVDGSSDWHPVCGTDAQPYPTVFVAGSKWNLQTGARMDDANAITLGCPDDAVGACIDWGYEPWVDREGCNYQWYPSFQSLGCGPRPGKDAHQTCMRAKRADFAGLGFSYTQVGNGILVGDSLNTPANALDPTFPNSEIEAIWGPDGATCLNRDNMRDEGQFPSPEAHDAYLSRPRCIMPPGPVDGIQVTGYNGN
jgi:hypothetical protein